MLASCFARASRELVTQEVVDLGELARGVRSSLGILAEERQQRLQVTSAEHVRVSADRLVLRDAVTNVVDNAIKYAPSGSTIDVRVDADTHHDSPRFVRRRRM